MTTLSVRVLSAAGDTFNVLVPETGCFEDVALQVRPCAQTCAELL